MDEAARSRPPLRGMRLAIVIVLGIDIAAAAVYMPAFALVWGVLSMLYRSDQQVTMFVVASWTVTVGGGAFLMWRVIAGRGWRSPAGLSINAAWAVLAVAIGVLGFPFFSLFGLLGLAISVMVLLLPAI